MTKLLLLELALAAALPGQDAAARGGRSLSSGVPGVAANAKGPNQINLTWTAAASPGYGYLVEIQSDGDSRYSSYTELQPIPTASGYTCDPAVAWHGATGCNISDPQGKHVYNPPVKGVPYWVTESTYMDPQDGTRAQFIAWGLKANTTYNFRIRTYSGYRAPSYGVYSYPVAAVTASYPQRYVSPTGKDSNDGLAGDDAHAWRTLNYAASHLTCGQELIVRGGTYASDSINMNQACTSPAKAVVMVSPGETATLSAYGNRSAVVLSGSHLVIDGLSTRYVGDFASSTDYDWLVNGSHNALLNITSGVATVPSGRYGVDLPGAYSLLYRSYIHDYGSPMNSQNGSGNDGYPLRTGTYGVIWSNHITRGGHDTGLCQNNCSYNRFLNNVHDGGWGMAFEVVYDLSHYNLFEGAISKSAGVLEAGIYKPAFELSNGHNTVRRGIFAGFASKGIEISAYGTEVGNQGNLVYNNVFYGGNKCYFQSHNISTAAYDHDMVVNNICNGFTGDATEIYLNNATPGSISYNSIVQAGGNGKEPVVVWFQESGRVPYENHQTVAFADANYGPAWSHNAELSTDPQFVDPANLDFHLARGSPLRGAGTRMTDTQWGFSFSAGVDLGAYGLR